MPHIPGTPNLATLSQSRWRLSKVVALAAAVVAIILGLWSVGGLGERAEEAQPDELSAGMTYANVVAVPEDVPHPACVNSTQYVIEAGGHVWVYRGDEFPENREYRGDLTVGPYREHEGIVFFRGVFRTGNEEVAFEGRSRDLACEISGA